MDSLGSVAFHDNIVVNEVAEELARGGSQSIDIPIYEMLEKIVYQRRWHLETGCRVSKAIMPVIWRRRTSSLISLSGNVVGILTDHCSIRYLKSRWDNSIPDYVKMKKRLIRLNIFFTEASFYQTRDIGSSAGGR